MLPRGTSIPSAVIAIYKAEGAKGLFAGVYPRMMWSALFGGVGLMLFESFKAVVGAVPENSASTPSVGSRCHACVLKNGCPPNLLSPRIARAF